VRFRASSCLASIAGRVITAIRAGMKPALTGVAISAIVGCSTTSNKTTGSIVALHTSVSTDPEIKSTFLTSFGWNVKLTEAKVALASLYYFDGPPAFVKNDLPILMPTDRVEQLFGIGVAYAHPGHYQAGEAMGQMITPSSYDLFASDPVSLADGNGVTGTYRSGRFVFPQTPSGPAAEQLDGHIAVVEGTATKASDASVQAPIHFRMTADFSDITRSASLGEVDGCDFTETTVDGKGTVHLVIHPSIWFNLVDFSSLNSGSDAAPTDVDAGTQPYVAFALGLAQLSAYNFSFSKP
jgi:hypothetical protein